MASVNNNTPTGGGQPAVPQPSVAGQQPAPQPLHPFFSVPDLSPDGDYEVLGVNVHHTLLPPSNAFFTLPGFPPPGGPFTLGIEPNPSGGGKGDQDPVQTDIGAYDADEHRTFFFDSAKGGDGANTGNIGSGGLGPIGGPGTTDSDGDAGGEAGGDNGGDQNDNDQGAGGDFGGLHSDGPTFSTTDVSDADGGEGGDLGGTAIDGKDNSDSDNGGGGDYSGGQHGRYIDGGDKSDSDDGQGEDNGGKNRDGTDSSDTDDINGTGEDYETYNDLIGGYINSDGGDYTKRADNDKDGAANNDTFGGDWWNIRSDGDSDGILKADNKPSGDGGKKGSDPDTDQPDASNFFHRTDSFGDHIGINVDSDSFSCDSSALFLQYPPPPAGATAAALLIAAMALLEAIPGILALQWFGEAEATNLFFQAQNMLGLILQKLGASDASAMIIEAYLNTHHRVVTNPVDLLNAGQQAASLLQPALTKIENQNTLFSLKALYAKNQCIPASCFANYATILAMDGAPFNICYDGAGGTDTGDHQADVGGGGPGGGLGQTSSTLIPVSSLAIPNLMPFGNISNFSLSPFPIASVANNGSQHTSRKS
jgi:hypothetical protein